MLLDIFLEFVLDVFYFLFMKYFNLYKKIERINIDINKLNELNDSIKAKVDD